MNGPSPENAGRKLPHLSFGSRIANYRLEEQVGVGGMAVVFRAVDVRLGRQVALKVLSAELAADESFRQRFMRESRAAAAVDDPHLIPIYEADDADGVLFIAMRYVAGGDALSLVQREGPLSAARAAALVSSVAEALDAAHAAGLVHRDVKPANILLDVRQGRPDHPYLTDFGISKRTQTLTRLTETGQFLGSPDYAAPEQIRGSTVDGRADQYALACSAFELLSGEPPFLRDEVSAVMWAQMTEPPPSLTSQRDGLLPAADGVLAKAMAKRPDERYNTCRDFADALWKALGLDVATPIISHPQAKATNQAWVPYADRLPETQDKQGQPTRNASIPSFKVQHPPMPAGTTDENSNSKGGKSQAARIQRRRAAAVGVASILAIATVAVGFTLINDMGKGNTRVPPRPAPTLRIAPRLVRTFRGPGVGYSGDVAYSPDGKRLVTANADGRTYLWDLTTGHWLATLTQPYYDGGKDKYDESVAYSPNGKTLAIGSGSTTYVWDIASKSIIDRLSVPNCPFGTNIAYGPNGTTLITACGRYNYSDENVGSAAGNTYLWDIATKHIIATFNAPQSLGVLSLAYSPRGTTLVTADYGDTDSNNHVAGKTYLWEIATRHIVATLTDPHSLGSSATVSYSHNNKMVATSDQNGNTDLWNVATGREIATLSNPHCQNQDVIPIEFSPDDTTLTTVCGAGKVVNLWNVATRHIVTTFTDPQSQGVASIAYSPNGTSLAAADGNGNTYVWTGVSR